MVDRSKQIKLNIDRIRGSMMENTGLCKWSGLHCRAIYYLDADGETKEISMFSTDEKEIENWLNGMINKAKAKGTIYQTLTI